MCVIGMCNSGIKNWGWGTGGRVIGLIRKNVVILANSCKVDWEGIYEWSSRVFGYVMYMLAASC